MRKEEIPFILVYTRTLGSGLGATARAGWMGGGPAKAFGNTVSGKTRVGRAI